MRRAIHPLSIFFACALLLAGCAQRKHYQLQTLPLPLPSAEHCCWQATQQLKIHHADKVIALNAALARTAQGASLVLLDPLGRRVFSIQQRGEHLETWRSPELPIELPETLLLGSSMMVWWPLADWDFPQGSPWSLMGSVKTDDNAKADTAERQLRWRGKPVLSASYSKAADQQLERLGPGSVSTPGPVQLRHHQAPLVITVVTTQWLWLDQANAKAARIPAKELN